MKSNDQELHTPVLVEKGGRRDKGNPFDGLCVFRGESAD